MTTGHEGRSSRSVLRCGICFRNLTIEPGRAMHEVYTDGSMRCAAPEATEFDASGQSIATHVVFDSPLRRVALERAFARGDLHDPTAVDA